jgi:hypothetical protein
MAYLAILPTAAVISDILPPDLARIVAEYARSLDVEVVALLDWSGKLEAELDPIYHPSDGQTYQLQYIDQSREPPVTTPFDPTLTCIITKKECIDRYYGISVSLGSVLLDHWVSSEKGLRRNICCKETAEYQTCYFLPFINILHARLQHAILRGCATHHDLTSMPG